MSEKIPLVTIPNTEVHLLQSSHAEQTYQLFVSLPQGYAESEEQYPVIYVTDANWCFSLFVNPLFSWLGIPQVIVVGIGYPMEDAGQIGRLRARDYLPTTDAKREKLLKEDFNFTFNSGGGGQFLSFLHGDLFEFVDNRYRTKAEDRTFWGFSWGGTFGVYTLFNRPQTFQRYIISAPDLSWDDEICFTYESDYAEKQTDLPVKLYLGVGSLDEDLIEHNYARLVRFHTILQSRNYEGLKMKFEALADEIHTTAAVISASRGLRFVFS